VPLAHAIGFTALVMLGAAALAFVATAIAITHEFVQAQRSKTSPRRWFDAAAAVAASLAAGVAYTALGGRPGEFGSPWQAVPICAAVVAWDVVARCYRSYSAAATHRADEDGPVDLDTLDEGVAVLDVDGLVTHWNSALARIVECPRERVVGRIARRGDPRTQPNHALARHQRVAEGWRAAHARADRGQGARADRERCA
jgi:PAS domain-containing protein